MNIKNMSFCALLSLPMANISGLSIWAFRMILLMICIERVWIRKLCRPSSAGESELARQSSIYEQLEHANGIRSFSDTSSDLNVNGTGMLVLYSLRQSPTHAMMLNDLIWKDQASLLQYNPCITCNKILHQSFNVLWNVAFHSKFWMINEDSKATYDTNDSCVLVVIWIGWSFEGGAPCSMRRQL